MLIFISVYETSYAQRTEVIELPRTSTSWPIPQGKIASIKIQAWGAGGAGGGTDKVNGGGGAGGGSGAYVEFTKTSDLSGTWFYVIGTGGVGVFGDGPAGSNTWINFSANAAPNNTTGLQATGGTGGERVRNKDVQGGTGGTGSFGPVSGGSLPIVTDGENGSDGGTLLGGKGGDSPNGGTGGAERILVGNGNAGSMPGGGGSGAFLNNATGRLGGNGGNGKIVLTITYIDAPTASNQNLCIGSNISDLVISNIVPGSTVKWFDQSVGGTELIPATTLTNNTTYYVSQTTNGFESDRTAVLVTLNPTSVEGSISGGGAIVCAGTNSTLLTLGGNTGIIQWQSSADGINYSNIASATAQTYNATNLTSATYYKAVVTSGACPSLTTAAATILVKQPGSWMGAINNNWNNAGNWCGSIPNASTDVTISSEFSNQPSIGIADATVRSLTISTGASVTIAANMTLNVWGDWTNNGTFTAAGGSVNFKKAGDQAIGGANGSTFNNISFEGGGSKLISKDVQINGAATFTSGYITSTNNSKLIFQTGSSVATGVANDASFAKVEVIKYGNADFEFPIGGLINAVNMYRPIKISNLQNTSSTDYFKAQHNAENPLNALNYLINRNGTMEVFKNELAQTLSTVSNVEYWNLSRSNSASVANVTMDFSLFPTTIANANFLRMAHYDVNASSWENAPNASGSRSYDFATKKLTVTNVNNFSPFTIGEIKAAALPVTLSSFTAKPTPDNKVSIGWVTSSEVSNKGFRIERQAGNENGKFEQIGFVGSKAKNGNSQNSLAYNFIDVAPKLGAASFYRLVQEDLDGKLTYTEVRMVKLNGQTVSMVFPNPSNGPVNISRTADGKKMNIQVIDQAGKIISQVNNITDANYRLNIPQSGVYTIKISYPETGEQSTQRIVVQK